MIFLCSSSLHSFIFFPTMFASTLTLCSVLLVAAVSAAPLKTRAGTTLSNGKGMQSGKISNSLSWQSSGKLIRGGCPGSVNIGVSLTLA